MRKEARWRGRRDGDKQEDISRFCDLGSVALILSIRSEGIFKNPSSQMLQLCKATSHICLRAATDGHLSLHNMRFTGWAGLEDSPESGNPTLLSASKSTPTLEGEERNC